MRDCLGSSCFLYLCLCKSIYFTSFGTGASLSNPF